MHQPRFQRCAVLLALGLLPWLRAAAAEAVAPSLMLAKADHGSLRLADYRVIEKYDGMRCSTGTGSSG